MKVKYPKIDLRARCHWVSRTTGEIVPTLKDVLRAALADLCNFHVVNVVWFYNKEGW